MAKKIKQKETLLQRIDHTIHTPNWLTALLGIVFVLRVPSFFEPFSYGDEMIYLTLGEGVRRGLTLYQDLHDNKPPLLYYLAALAGNVFWFRVILAAWMFVTIVIFWKLTKALFPKDIRVQQVATILFALLTTIPLFEGQIANAELFLVGPTIGAFLLVLKKNRRSIHYLLAGFLLAIATLFKVPALFDVAAIVIFWFVLLVNKKQTVAEFLKKNLLLGSAFLVPILITLIWFASKGALQEYLSTALLQNVGYLSSWRPGDVERSFLERNLPLLMRGSVVLIGSLILLAFRKKLSMQFVFVTLWLLTSLFAITLSERPYPHYLIQAIPSISLLLGILIAKKSVEQALVIFPLMLALFVPVYYKFWYYPTLGYYERFVEFATGKLTKEDYFTQFDGTVNRNYKVATFIQNVTDLNDPVFVWGDSASVYALSRRLPPIKYVATYHINEFSSKDAVVSSLSVTKPSLIVILPEGPDFPEIIPLLYEDYVQIATIDEAVVWKRAPASTNNILQK